MNRLIPFLALQIASYQAAIENRTENSQKTDIKYPALIFEFDIREVNWYEKNISYLTACPATTSREKIFNDQVSITGKSLFSRNVYKYTHKSIASNICDTPIEPVTVYNLLSNRYEIGYELYYTIDDSNGIISQATNYLHYKPVNIHHKIVNRSKPQSKFVTSHQDGNQTIFFLKNESQSLAFNWISELSFSSTGYNKHVTLKQFDYYSLIDFHSLGSKCKDYKRDEIDDDEMHVYLRPTLPDRNVKQSELQLNGNVTMSQIVPLWYFSKAQGKLASCMYMNRVPVWRSIAEGQLNKVDRYLHAIIYHWRTEEHLFHDDDGMIIENVMFGVSEVFHSENVYVSDSRSRQKVVIPKIIYRFIETRRFDTEYNALIIIHNDPTGVTEEERICSNESRVPGWEKITNEDAETGITYVCQCRTWKVFPDRLGIHVDDGPLRPLRLNAIHRVGGAGGSRVFSYDENMKGKIEDDYRYISRNIQIRIRSSLNYERTR